MALVYRIHAGNSAGGAVDYTTVVATTSSLSISLAALPLSSTTRLAVRAYDTVSLLDDGNTDAVVAVTVDGSGADLTGAPYAPQALRATATAGGGVRIEWSYPFLDATRLPVGFHTYQGTGGAVSYGAAVATTPWTTTPGRAFRATVAGLTDGVTYVFGVRSYNAHGEESNTVKVTVTAVSTPPANVAALAAVVS